jgi:hypothetical protein
MKKVSKPTKKPAVKKPLAKKSPAKLDPQAETRSQLAQVVTRLEIVADKLPHAAETFAVLHEPHTEASPVPAAQPPMREVSDEHADDAKVASAIGKAEPKNSTGEQ